MASFVQLLHVRVNWRAAYAQWRMPRSSRLSTCLYFRQFVLVAGLHTNPPVKTTLIMVRTQCCEAHRNCGQRCAICPNRPENRAAVLRYRQESACGLGCNRFTASLLKFLSCAATTES